MKKCILVLAIVLSSVALFAQGVNFQELTLKEACAKAKAENKFVFIDIDRMIYYCKYNKNALLQCIFI